MLKKSEDIIRKIILNLNGYLLNIFFYFYFIEYCIKRYLFKFQIIYFFSDI